jgi:hypothetical protein
MNLKTQAVENEKWIDEIALIYSQEKDMQHVSVHHTKAGEGIFECAKYTASVIEGDAGTILFKVVDADNEMAVAGLFSDIKVDGISAMAFWFIAPEYRNEAGVLSFWKLLKNHFGGSFFTTVSKKNSKAFDHLKRQGFSVILTVENYSILKCN